MGQLLSNDDDTRKVREIVEQGLQVSVGDGCSILFWHDKWVSPTPLRVSFPRLFGISLQSEVVISQIGEWMDNVWVWRLRWRRQLYEWEIAEVERLMIMVENFPPKPSDRDGVTWYDSSRDRFPTKDILDKLHESCVPFLAKQWPTLFGVSKFPRGSILSSGWQHWRN